MISGNAWTRASARTKAEMSASAGGMALSVPSAGSEVSVRACLGLGPAVQERSGSILGWLGSVVMGQVSSQGLSS